MQILTIFSKTMQFAWLRAYLNVKTHVRYIRYVKDNETSVQLSNTREITAHFSRILQRLHFAHLWACFNVRTGVRWV
jgi:hypothetical protein